MKIGICIIAYNRLNSLKRVLSTLEQAYYCNESVELIISIDKSNNNSVELFAKEYKWNFGNKKVIAHPKNLGLRKHVLKCGDLLNDYEALIVLEDDISVAPSFYQYAKQCIEKYKDNEKIAGISLYNFPINYHNALPFDPIQSDSDVYLMQCAQSWGQIWMKKQWFKFREWYDLNSEEFNELPHLPKSICRWPKSSWLKYHTRYCIENNKYFIYPYVSLTTNNSDLGTHVGKRNTLFQSNLLWGKKEHFNLNPQIIYDGFFENENISDVLNLKKEDLCVDFYGEKNNFQNSRYLITRKKLNYSIIKSYSLSYKPYELNIINDINGNDIFLYDTKKTCKNNNRNIIVQVYYYLYNIPSLKFLIKKIIKTYINNDNI